MRRLAQDHPPSPARLPGPAEAEGARAEDELVRRARAGDGEAFEQLVRRHFARVHALLFRLVGNHEDAEDLAQDTFVRAHGALRCFRGQAPFARWLQRIALHLAHDHFRRRGRRGRALELSEPAAPERSESGSPGEQLSQRELEGLLAAGLERLPHRVHAALVLRSYEQLDYGEIGAVLGITPATARVHVMKARRLLARWLGPWLRREEP